MKPAWPVIVDTLNHIFSEAAHQSSVHAHDGHNHVEIETAKITNENKQQGSVLTQAEPLSVHLIILSFDEIAPFSPSDIQKYILVTSRLASRSSAKLYPPPRV